MENTKKKKGLQTRTKKRKDKFKFNQIENNNKKDNFNEKKEYKNMNK